MKQGKWRRVYGFNFARSLPEHFNSSLGAYVSNTSEVKSELSRQSDEMSERMGFTHQYELVDPHEPAAAGVTEAGLEATERAAVDDGRVEVKKFL